ncbi:MAG: glycosyltransferase family 2 protein [Candidatus Omnitrophica bacterium]|nr:glycosyltransferase family 2 protein [Candidatus Omnitrophota bacterium]
MQLLILIPAHNESRAIGGVVGRLVPRYQVLVIDDGSQDETAAAARRAGAEVMRLPQNRGKGTALRQGFQAALARGCEAVVVMDGDGQHDPDDLPRMMAAAAATKAGIVVGNRLSARGPMPRLRWYTNRLMSWIVSQVCHQTIPDSQCGFRWIARAVLEGCVLTTDRFEIESELLVAASRAGFAIASVPVRSIYDAGQNSAIRPWQDTWRILRLWARVARR